MIAAAQVAYYARNGARWGVQSGPVSVDLSEVVNRKNSVVQQWRGGQERSLARHPSVRLFRGHARFECVEEEEGR